MKKIGFLMLSLAGVMVLGGWSKDAKKPSFAAQGKEVAFADFEKAFNEKIENNEFLKPKKGEYVPSFKSTTKSAESETNLNKRGNKIVKQKRSAGSSKSSTKYDAKRGVAENVESGKSQSDEFDFGYKSNRKSQTSVDFKFQKASEEGKEYLAQVDLKSKTYNFMTPVDEDEKYEDLFSSLAYMAYSDGYEEFAEIWTNYVTAKEEEKSNYKFYQNKNLYTIEFKKDSEGEYKYNDEVKYSFKDNRYSKVQVDLKNAKKIKVTYYSERTRVRTYAVAYEDYLPKDVQTIKNRESIVMQLTKTNVSVKQQNLAKFAKTED